MRVDFKVFLAHPAYFPLVQNFLNPPDPLSRLLIWQRQNKDGVELLSEKRRVKVLTVS